MSQARNGNTNSTLLSKPKKYVLYVVTIVLVLVLSVIDKFKPYNLHELQWFYKHYITGSQDAFGFIIKKAGLILLLFFQSPNEILLPLPFILQSQIHSFPKSLPQMSGN